MQPMKTPEPMVSTFSGIVSETREEQFLKALLPIVLTELPIATDIMPLQFSKADSPMKMTDSGIMKLATFDKPRNNLGGICLTLLPITTLTRVV